MSKPLSYYLDKLWLGLTLRCPNCGQTRMFNGLFVMQKTCPNCGVRYERRSGESLGGMFINLGLAEFISVFGFFGIQLTFNPPMVPHVIFWVTFNILFVLLFYRHARGLWVAINYVSGGVYVDRDSPPKQADPPRTKD